MKSSPFITEILYRKSKRCYKNSQLALDDIHEIEKNIDLVIIPSDGDYQIDEDDMQGFTLPLDVPQTTEIFS